MAWPDVEVLLVDALAHLGETDSRAPWPMRTPFVVVIDGGGPRTDLTGQSRVDVQVYGPEDREIGRGLLVAVDDFLTDPDVRPWWLDSVDCQLGPHEAPWADPKVRLFVATYLVGYRATD